MCDGCEDGCGFIECYIATGGRYTPILKRCPNNCNEMNYSREFQRRNEEGYVTESPVLAPRPAERTAQVLPFKRKGEPSGV
jgi:hypothetical protein